MSEILTGKNAVQEALRAQKRKCYEIWISHNKKELIVADIVTSAEKRGLPIHFVDDGVISSLSLENKHQRIAGRFDPYPYACLEKIISDNTQDKKSFLLFLDNIQDPHNLGSLIRTAHLLGVKGIVIPKDNSALITPTVVKVSAGATEYMDIVLVTNLVNVIKDLKKQGFWIVGAEEEGASSVYQFDFTGGNYALILGSEGKGIRRLVRENCDHLVYIPMFGKIGSYNVSVAGAIIISEAMRQREKNRLTSSN
ncbi:MAG: 23S rRNA (guanosine(2251)-2'-O)-methyltransferase RlmB [Deltaproteobacteria bacterium CG07_land_8_20_14_0_80_38_7]|nr:MAG: 23S rRNA (guanosine(2251)-2'-O)-methyltransferase RlmB [Deltaproteobacteria bacterium CG07_land_8_20_14_0_80_38_7]